MFTLQMHVYHYICVHFSAQKQQLLDRASEGLIQTLRTQSSSLVPQNELQIPVLRILLITSLSDSTITLQ